MGKPNINVNVGGPEKAGQVYKTIVLKGNLPFKVQATEADTNYVIRYNFDLNGETITIPSGCMLTFEGGMLSNGTVNINGAKVLNYELLDQVTVTGNPAGGSVKYADHDYWFWNGTEWMLCSDEAAIEALKGGSIKTIKNLSDEIAAENQRAVAAENDRYTKAETYNKTELNSLITTPNQEYVTVATYADLLALTGSADTVYRVSNYDGSATDATKYAEYAWDGTQYILLSVKTQIGEVFDITAYNSNTEYANLSAALGVGGANVPSFVRKGGMSVKYVSSVDNRYVQFRYMGTETTGTPNPFLDTANWQGEDAEPTAGSKNLVESGGVAGTEQVINNRLGDVSTFAFTDAGEKPFYTKQGYTYIVTNTGSAFCVVTLRIERSGTGYNRTELGAGQSAEITAEIDARWLRCGQATSLTFKLKNNVEDRLDSTYNDLAKQTGKVENLYSVVAVSPIGGVSLETNECYLNSTSGNIVRKNADGTITSITPKDGLMVLYKGVTMYYSSESQSWIPLMDENSKVACGTGTKFRWRVSNGKILPFMADSASTDYVASIPQKIHIGDKVIAQGVGTETNNLLIVTDEQFNVTQTFVGTGEKAPIVFISDIEGYVFHNCTTAREHYIYVSSAKNQFEIIGIFGANPKTYYNVNFSLMDCYYHMDGRFIINDGANPLNITEFIKAVGDNGTKIVCKGKEYTYDKYGLFDGFGFKLNIDKQTPLLPATIAQYKNGINFQYNTFCDEIYAKFDSLSTNFASYITKYDAVTLANSYGHSISYPEYCNLGGQASGSYLPTPTYRTYLYKIVAPVSTPLNQTNYNSKRRVLLIGGNHPYEIAAPANLYLFIRNLLETMSSDADAFSVMANTEFYILPCLNGYGIYHAQDGYMRINANGVNLNRNFPTERWSQGTAGTQDYGGDSAGSEFETKLVMYLTDGIVPHLCIDAHNFDKALRQFFGTFGVGKTNIQDAIYKFFIVASQKLKETYPEVFGTAFGYLTEQDGTIEMASVGSSNDWWSSNGNIKESSTFEVSRCLNYDNGVVNLTDFIDDYGNTLFSVNEYGFRVMLYILLNKLI